MFKKSIITALMIFAIIGGAVMPVQASGTLYVGTSGTNQAVTYSTVDNAIENATDGTTIEIAPGTYNVSTEVNTNNITINRDSSVTSGTVTLDATTSKYGSVFRGEYGHAVTTGSNVALTDSTVIVDSANTANTDTYGTITDAVDNSTDNTTVQITPGEYKTSVNVTSQNLAFVNNAPNSGSVTINATNTSEGTAFYGQNADSVYVGSHVTVEEKVIGIGGGAIGDAAMSSIFGIPLWAISVVTLLLGYVYYDDMN